MCWKLQLGSAIPMKRSPPCTKCQSSHMPPWKRCLRFWFSQWTLGPLSGIKYLGVPLQHGSDLFSFHSNGPAYYCRTKMLKLPFDAADLCLLTSWDPIQRRYSCVVRCVRMEYHNFHSHYYPRKMSWYDGATADEQMKRHWWRGGCKRCNSNSRTAPKAPLYNGVQTLSYADDLLYKRVGNTGYPPYSGFIWYTKRCVLIDVPPFCVGKPSKTRRAAQMACTMYQHDDELPVRLLRALQSKSN